MLTFFIIHLGWQSRTFKWKAFIKESRPYRQPQKIVIIAPMKVNPYLPLIAELEKSENPVEVRNLSDKSVNIEEKIISITEISSKMYKLTTYEKAISRSIYTKK